MAEMKAKRKLQEVSLKWKTQISTDNVMGIFKNTEKYTYERQCGLLKQMFKPYVNEFDKHQAQFDEDVKKNHKSPYEAFINLLLNITIVQNPTKPLIPLKPQTTSDSKLSSKSSGSKSSGSKIDFESPALCSTRVDNTERSEIVVSEVSLYNNQRSSKQIIFTSCRSKKSLRKRLNKLRTRIIAHQLHSSLGRHSIHPQQV